MGTAGAIAVQSKMGGQLHTPTMTTHRSTLEGGLPASRASGQGPEHVVGQVQHGAVGDGAAWGKSDR
jgi:hypothetical protein